MRAYLIVAACLWIACSDAAAQMYRWVDDKGGVHYTQTPPPPQAKDVQRKNLRQGGTSSPDLPYAAQVAAKNYPVTLYSQPGCGSPCDRERALLVNRAVPFREVSVLSQKELDEVKQISGGTQLPLLIVGSLKQVGVAEGVINSLLDTAGYPPPGQRVPIEALRKPEPAAAPGSAPQQPASGQANADYR
jgi:glutaredoxin